MRSRLAHLTTGIVLTLLAVWLPESAAADGRRYALVIGNSDYAVVPVLPSPINDAADVGDALAKVGFDVTYGLDVGRNEFRMILGQFAAKSTTSEAVVFYYAGHGFALRGTNHLVPVDARLVDPNEIASETVTLDDVIAAIAKPGRPTMIFLDASRASPLPPAMRDDPGSEGLAEVSTIPDLFIAASAAPGKTVVGGPGRNSAFTRSMIAQLRRSEVSLSGMMSAIRTDVSDSTGGAQVPWDQSSLRSDFIFTASEANAANNPETADGTDENSTDDGSVSGSSSGASEGQAQPLEGEVLSGADPTANAEIQTDDAAEITESPATKSKRNVKTKTAKPRTVTKSTVKPAAKAKAKSHEPSAGKVASGKRPSAVQYSLRFWPVDSIAKGRRVRQQTEHGQLVCQFLDERNKHDPFRLCSWH